VLALGRDLALAGLDLLPALRRQFVQQAAGMAALEAQHG
jgi:2-octaprenyl-6-methoxyphenol hydroxylase